MRLERTRLRVLVNNVAKDTLGLIYKANTTTHSAKFVLPRAFSTSGCYLKPSDRKYTEKHEWVSVKDKVGTVGITNYAQEALGEIVFAQLPDVGSSVTQSVECGALESVKAASDVYSPVSGKVLETNETVLSETSLINKSCYEKGWLFKIELSKPAELDNLMNDEKYEKFIKTLQH